MLIVFDDRIVDMEANKKLSPLVTEMFLERKKTQHFTSFYITIRGRFRVSQVIRDDQRLFQ